MCRLTCRTWICLLNIKNIKKQFLLNFSSYRVPRFQSCVTVDYKFYIGPSCPFVNFDSFTHTPTHTSNGTGKSCSSCLPVCIFSCVPNQKLVIWYKIRNSQTASVTFRDFEDDTYHVIPRKMYGIVCDTPTVFWNITWTHCKAIEIYYCKLMTTIYWQGLVFVSEMEWTGIVQL
jgi:hypothetical protein